MILLERVKKKKVKPRGEYKLLKRIVQLLMENRSIQGVEENKFERKKIKKKGGGGRENNKKK